MKIKVPAIITISIPDSEAETGDYYGEKLSPRQCVERELRLVALVHEGGDGGELEDVELENVPGSWEDIH